jgi:hypothetical protein
VARRHGELRPHEIDADLARLGCFAVRMSRDRTGILG